MATYFETKNSDGATVQLDDTHSIYSVASYGKFSSIYVGHSIRPFISIGGGTTGSYYIMYLYALPIDNSNKIVYVHNPSSSSNVYLMANNTWYGSSTSYNFNGYTRTQKMIIYGVIADKSIADNLEYYVFTEGSKDAGNIGINVFNASGSMIFSSSDTNLAIQDYSFHVNGNPVCPGSNQTVGSNNFSFAGMEKTYSFPVAVNMDIGMAAYKESQIVGDICGYDYGILSRPFCVLNKYYVKMTYAGITDFTEDYTVPYGIYLVENDLRNFTIYSVCKLYSKY
jgi:hypothetical protein